MHGVKDHKSGLRSRSKTSSSVSIVGRIAVGGACTGRAVGPRRQCATLRKGRGSDGLAAAVLVSPISGPMARCCCSCRCSSVSATMLPIRPRWTTSSLGNGMSARREGSRIGSGIAARAGFGPSLTSSGPSPAGRADANGPNGGAEEYGETRRA